MRRFIHNHRGAVIAGAAILAGLVVFVVVWFQPQKLFIEQTVNEGVPGVAGEDDQPSPGGASEGRDSLSVLRAGRFQSLEHETSGSARVIEVADGRLFLRFEDLDTSNGPDLRVYLSEIPASDDWYAYGKRFIDLGALKGNLGDQNYEIPQATDLSRYRSAVIWCRRFTVGFGVAPLDP